jgi:acyl carrier protein
MSSTIAEKELDSPEVLGWLTVKFADWLEVAPDELDSQQPIASYGLDSISAVTLSVQLEEELGVELDTAVLWERPTLESLAEHLSEKLNASGLAVLPDVGVSERQERRGL